MSQILVTGEAKVRDIQGPVVANSGVITALDGDASQYVRGDGTLADFPTSTGGGSSVSYYLNSSVSQGTIGGVAYRQLSKTPISGAGTDITASTNGYIASYLTDANDPALLEVPAGNFNCEFYFSVNSNAHNPYVYAELYKYDGTTFTLLGSNVAIPEYLTNGTTLSAYYFAIPVAVAALTVTDRIAIRIYVNVDGRTVTLHTENNHLCQVVTTFSKGLTTLNNLTRQVQFFGTGTSGTDFGIVSSVATHTFNLPVASAANTGKLSSTDWSTFNGKVPYSGATTNVNLGVYSLTANQLIAGGASTDNVATLTTFDQGHALKLKGSTGDLFFVPYFSPSIGARITAQNTAASANTPLSFYASNFYFNTNVNFGSTLGNGTYTYTLPSATGTLALTSNLSAYLPLSGGTLTGALSGTSATFTGANSTDVVTIAAATAKLRFQPYSSSGDSQILAEPIAGGSYNPLTLIGSTIKLFAFTGSNDIQLWTNNVQRLTINSSGNVGIGTTSPTAVGNFSTLAINGSVGGILDLKSNGTTGLLMFSNASATILSEQRSAYMSFETSATERMRITSGGNIGIGIVNPSYQLQLSTDSAAKPTSALWTIASDKRIKENINPYKKGLQELLKINPITYDYNGLGGFIKGKGGVGIIAQEIIDILPDSVNSIKGKLNAEDEEETDILNFNGHELIYVLINAIKEQQAQIEELKQLIKNK